jgi:hypothetical protein
VRLCDLQHHPVPGVSVELEDERHNVGDVVDDVVAHQEIRSRYLVGDVRPPSVPQSMWDSAPPGKFGQLGEQLLALVHGNHQRRRGGQRQRGPTGPGSHVEDAPPGPKSLQLHPAGGRLRRLLQLRAGGGCEDRDGESPGLRRRRPENLLRHLPGCEVLCPALPGVGEGRVDGPTLHGPLRRRE